MKYIITALVILLVGFGAYWYYDSQKMCCTPPDTQNSNVLNLSNKGLDRVPDDTFKRTTITSLDISNNNLTGAIQGEIRNLSKLKVLDMSDNNLTGVPAEIGQLSQLEELDMSNNKLTGLPNELGNLMKLKKLNISGNQYSEQDLKGILEKLPKDVVVIK